jgi:hypothetical protein
MMGSELYVFVFLLSDLRRDLGFGDVTPSHGCSQSGVVGSQLAHPTTSDWPSSRHVPGPYSIV